MLIPPQPQPRRRLLKTVVAEIQRHIVASQSAFAAPLAGDPKCYVLKWLRPSFLESVQSTGKLFASNIPGYTWGDGVYVVPISCPYSTMIYGRVGIVGTITPSRVYDATCAKGHLLYQEWVQHQWPYASWLATTVHDTLANWYLRNAFKNFFKIDCIMFRPDQLCYPYIDGTSDIWFCVSAWTPAQRTLSSGLTDAVQSPIWCATCPEKFKKDSQRIYYTPMLENHLPANLQPAHNPNQRWPNLETDLIATYRARTANPASPILQLEFA